MGLFLKYQCLDCRLEFFIFRMQTALLHKHKSNLGKTLSVCSLLYFILLESFLSKFFFLGAEERLSESPALCVHVPLITAVHLLIG